MEDNGNGTAETRVPFGDRDWQTLPVEWAGMLLREWRRRHPAQFAKIMGDVAADIRDK